MEAALSESEAKAIAERWKTWGDSSVSSAGRCRMTSGYQAWRQRVEAFLSKPPAAMRHQIEPWRHWLGEYEAYTRWMSTQKGPAPKVPGPVPFELVAQVLDGEPIGPPPSSFRRILIYHVKLPDGARYSFQDDPVQLDGKSASHETGISRIGLKIHKRAELEALLDEAGITDATERKVLKKIAEQEGGFEAINTCDAGEVSVGFVPFTSGEAGDGPLSRLLRSIRVADPGEFDVYFRSLGIDVGEKGLMVVHLEQGRLLQGREAVRALRDDKRLSAVFQNAGERSRMYQIAQLRLAKEMYYVASHDFALKTLVKSGDRALVITFLGRYGDVLRSEAGKVALMDRAVHRGVGNTRQVFKEACISVIHEKGLNTLRALAEYEALIVPILQTAGRIRALEDKELSQPGPPPEH
ncbi:hypothetical protein [Hyalangium sp.]|uniref:hypothetical protein n=1 Tax=Hyalangium sp. TaxID=2028555 RepID=UPI002D4DBF5F|nr:hypothetical protein [Hyalangium sp.]HYH94446.1 hypothetical protein [Hyalangium sp.]